MPRSTIIMLGPLLVFFLAPAPASLADADTAAGHPAVRAWIEAWETGADNLDSFLTEDVSYKDPFYSASDRQGYRDIVLRALSDFQDLAFTADDLILDGDRGALAWTGTATHVASGKAVRIQGVSILRFEGGKIASEWRVFDGEELITQIRADGGDGDGNASE